MNPTLLLPVGAIGAALGVGAILIAIAGANPWHAYGILLQESLANYYGLGNTLTKTAPLLLAGLGVWLALRGGQFNIGGEGQIYLGGLGGALAGLWLPNWPVWLHLPLALMAAFAFGAVWGAIPGYLKAQCGINEVISTLLLNYIAINLISYLVQHPLAEPGAPSPYSPPLAPSARLPIILPQTQAHAGVILALLATIAVWLLMHKSRWGYEITVVGLNPQAAHYGGISVARTIVWVMAVAGGLCGLAGACEVMGLKYRLFENFSPGYGFDAIAIAFLSRDSVAGVVLASLFFGILRSGANVMQRSAGVPVTIVYAIQGLTVLFIAISLAIASRRPWSLPPQQPPSS